MEGKLDRVFLGLIGLGWLVGLVELVGFLMCSIENQPFSVGLVDQLFQPTRTRLKWNNGIDCYHNCGLLSVA